jgi:polar amino acid transport system permease protein
MNPDIIVENAVRLGQGFAVTLQLVGWSLFFAGLLAFPLAVALRSRRVWLRAPAQAYSTFFRGSPLIAQLFLIYYGSGQFNLGLQDMGLWWFFRDAFFCAVLAFSLNSAAYTAELIRGALDAVPRGQWEAAGALGLPHRTVLRRIILPQAARIALPAYGNEVILMVKASAIALIVTLYDLMGTAKLIYARTFDITIYFWAALAYIVIVALIRIGVGLIERRAFRWAAR